ncbi:MAG: hypothetical protein ABIF88_02100 [archaeon]
MAKPRVKSGRLRCMRILRIVVVLFFAMARQVVGHCSFGRTSFDFVMPRLIERYLKKINFK